jgi:CYTH domain-containing protein
MFEIERKYKLTPDEAVELLRENATTAVTIHQTYLASSPWGAVRVRKTHSDDGVVATIDCKVPTNNPDVRFEFEHEIDEHQADELLLKRGGHIAKTRHLIETTDGCQWTLDVIDNKGLVEFLGGEPICLLECEAPNLDTLEAAVTCTDLPTHNDVTSNHQWSNAAIFDLIMMVRA